MIHAQTAGGIIVKATSALSIAADALLGRGLRPVGVAGRDVAAARRGGGASGAGRRRAAGRARRPSGDRCDPGAGRSRSAGSALTQTVLFYGATFWGIAHAGAGLSAVLANTDPLFVAILATLVLGERLGTAQWAGLAIGLAGAACVVWEGPLWPPAALGRRPGCGGGALAWSVGTVVASRSVRGRGDPLALAGWQMAVGGIVLWLTGAIAREPSPSLGWREARSGRSASAIVGSAAPLALFYMALMRAPASEVSAWFFLIPVIGVLSAWPSSGRRRAPAWSSASRACRLGLWLVLARPRPADRGGW